MLIIFADKMSKNIFIVHYREKIPLHMREGCSEIYPAVLINIRQGRDAYFNIRDVNTPYVTNAYGPAAEDQNGNWREG